MSHKHRIWWDAAEAMSGECADPACEVGTLRAERDREWQLALWGEGCLGEGRNPEYARYYMEAVRECDAASSAEITRLKDENTRLARILDGDDEEAVERAAEAHAVWATRPAIAAARAILRAAKGGDK